MPQPKRRLLHDDGHIKAIGMDEFSRSDSEVGIGAGSWAKEQTCVRCGLRRKTKKGPDRNPLNLCRDCKNYCRSTGELEMWA